MGSKQSKLKDYEAYKVAVDENKGKIPPGKRELPVVPRQSEPHPLWYLYDYNLSSLSSIKDIGLETRSLSDDDDTCLIDLNPIEITGDYCVEVLPVKPRKVKFDDIVNPHPHACERHPFYLDYGEGIRPPNNDLMIYSLGPEEIPVKARQVKFEDILIATVFPRYKEFHPVVLDFNEGIARKHNDPTLYFTPERLINVKSRQVKFEDILDPTPRYSESHPFLLDYGEPVRRHHPALYEPLEFFEPHQISAKSRKLKFDDVLDPAPRCSELHPFLLDYGEPMSRWHPALYTSWTNRTSGSFLWFPCDVPVRSRRVKFDDIVDPAPLYSELHPFLLDYGEGIARSISDPFVYLTPAEEISIKPRLLKFDDILSPAPRRAELHPMVLDQGEGLPRKLIPYDFEPLPKLKWPKPLQFGLDYTPQVSERHPFKLHYGCNFSRFAQLPPCLPPQYMYIYRASNIRFVENDRNSPDNCEAFEPPVGKKVHFTILNALQRPPRRKLRGRRPILKRADEHENCVTVSEKILHESLVLACHLYWSLRKTEHQEVEGLSVAFYLSISPEKREKSPMTYAPNRKFLASGCPTFVHLSKVPEIDFPERPRIKPIKVVTEELHEEEVIRSCPSVEDEFETEYETDDDMDLPVRENLHLAIETHGQLKQSCFPHLRTTTVSKQSVPSEHKVRLTMRATNFGRDDIDDYLWDVCNIGVVFKHPVTIADVLWSGALTSCNIVFRSLRTARRFKSHIDRNKHMTLCHAEMHEARHGMDFIQQSLTKTMDKLYEESLSSLACHQSKLEEIATKLQNTGTKKYRPAEVQAILDEQQALRQKWQELKNQEEEYMAFVKIFQQRFLNIPNTVHWRDEAAVMEQRFHIERERLHAALPMYAKRTEIVQMIAENQVSILLGETGSGKSTQVTQYLYEAGLAKQKRIVCTQPRKVAATSLAKRVSSEMHSQVGDIVGYIVGMQKQVSRDTKILYVTDHMLLKECQKDPLLTSYSCVIIDEAHERSLNTDLLLGMIKRALISRPELRVVVTSATINPDVFVAFFNGCPVLKVSGRVFPVEVFYDDEPVDADSDFVKRAVQKAHDVALKPEPGDILVFLTTPLETEQACEKLKKKWPNDKNSILCLALHGKTQSMDQQRVFNPTPARKRKIVFATNSAETSVTIPGIKVVIDTGLAKEKLYDHKRNMSSLKVNKISQSSAEQRKGRAGRTERGKCYRLYREDDFESMDVCTQPEIMKVHLGMALLTLLSFDIEDPLSFDFVEMPPREGLRKAMDVLVYLEAVGEDGKLTPLGKKLAMMSLEPRMGKLVLNGIDRNIGFESILVASFSTMGGNMFFRGGNEKQKEKADKLKVRFCNLRGDIHTMLDVYKEWNCQPEKAKNKWCMDNSINAKSMRMVRESIKEIQNTLSSDLGIKLHHTFHADKAYMEATVETVIVESYAMNLCVFAGHESLGYMGVTDVDKLVHVHPSSALKSLAKSPRYMVYENTLTTSRAFVINITCISEATFEACRAKGNPVIDLEEVNSRVTSPSVVNNIGTATAKKICGVKHSTRIALEKDLQVFFHTEMLTLETKVDQGTVTVYATPGVRDECNRLVKRMVVREQEALYKEEMERPLVEGCATRVVLEHGGQTKLLLFSDEFRTLHIPSVPYPYDPEYLVEQFREVAVVTDYVSYDNKRLQRKGLRVTFEDQELAEEVLDLLRHRGNAALLPTVDAKPDLTGARGVTAPYAHSVSLKITWCRRMNKGIAFVMFQPHQPDAARNILTDISHINISGHVCRMQLAKKNKTELFLCNIPKTIPFHDVSKAIRQKIEEATVYRPTDVRVPTEKPMETSQSDCNQYKRIIETHIELEASEVADVEVNLRKPKIAATQFVAFINLKNGPDAAKIQAALEGMTIMGQTATIDVTLKSVLIVRKELFRYIQGELEAQIEEQEYENEGVHCRGEWMRNGPGGYRLEISARTANDLAFVRSILAKCVEGHRIEMKAKHLQYFKFNRNGQAFVQKLQNRNHVLISMDLYHLVLILHGGEEDVEQTIEEIDWKVEELEQSHTKVFDLKEQYPAGMTKRLMGQYGLDVQDLAYASGADSVNLQLRQHLLTVTGPPENVDNVQKLLNTQALVLMEKMKEKLEPNLETCPVCLDEVPSSEQYRLEYCGHAYCDPCVKGMLEHGARAKSFPIQCAKEGCGKDIVIKDILTLVGAGMDRLRPFILASAAHYVMKHPKDVKNCITPDCNMIYPVRPDLRDVEVCSACQVKICTHCHKEYHPPLSCEVNEALGGRSYDEYCKETWLEEDRRNRALCPQCKFGIEKNGGCLRVHCPQCKTHICWRCKAYFTTSEEAYAHLRACNDGTVFDRDEYEQYMD